MQGAKLDARPYLQALGVDLLRAARTTAHKSAVVRPKVVEAHRVTEAPNCVLLEHRSLVMAVVAMVELLGVVVSVVGKLYPWPGQQLERH